MSRFASPAMVLILVTAGITGCAGNPAVGPEILVTFPIDRSTDTHAGGSQRAYHSDDAWPVSLHTRQLVRRFARDHGLVADDAWPIHALDMYCVSFQARDQIDQQSLVRALSADQRVSLVQPNHSFQGMTSTRMQHDDPLFDIQYGDARGDLEKLHSITMGNDVRVAVIDSSVDLNHPDLTGQITRQVEFVTAASDAERMHGTAVTGIIGASANNGVGLVGLAPAAAIHVFGACGESGTGAPATVCSSFTLLKALAGAIEENMDVVNMSLAGPEDQLIGKLIDVALDSGTIVVAAGNSEDPERSFPASMPSVHSPSRNREYWFARTEQLSTQAGGSYQVFFGSSIASAGITGIAALLRSRYTPEETNTLLSWLYSEDCRASPSPLKSVAFDLEQMCD